MIVNIIGRAEGWEEGYEAPGEHWAINYFHHKTDVLFEIHPPDHPFHDKLTRDRNNAIAAGIPLITHENYPLAEVMAEFGTDYFGSSTDWLLAYAIYYGGYDEIHLWGVAMDDKGGHYEMRCATDFWCGIAIGRGLKVVVHGNSMVMTTFDGLQYGTFRPMQRKYTDNS